MLIDDKQTDFYLDYLSLFGFNPERCVFFDIETTGFKPEYSSLYMIGAAFKNEEGWMIRQWTAQSPSEQETLLRLFAAFLSGYTALVCFNGEHFDLPYLKQKYQQYNMADPFEEMDVLDLYKQLRPYRNFLGLEKMNQKALEAFLGIRRDDRYDGGALIPVYREYCKTRDSASLALLLLHNVEDVEGMLKLCALLSYPLALSENAGRTDAAVHLDAEYGKLTFRCPVPIPVEVSAEQSVFSLHLSKDEGTLSFPLVRGELKYFFPDYKNYDYLPAEDMAIHRSLSAFMDASLREKAKPATCYTRRAGVFLPQPKEAYAPVFRRAYDDPVLYFEAPKDSSGSFAADYLTLCLGAFRPKGALM